MFIENRDSLTSLCDPVFTSPPSENACMSPATGLPMLVVTPPVVTEQAEPWSVRTVQTLWRSLMPQSLRMSIYNFRKRRVAARAQRQAVTLPIDRLLLGNQGILSASKFAQLRGQLLYPSTAVNASPYMEFLRLHEEMGESMLDTSVLRETSWYCLVADCIRLTGRYGEATSEDQIQDCARKFIKKLGTDQQLGDAGIASNGKCIDPIEVRPIAFSDCFQIIEGHHRAAISWHKGQRTIPAVIQGQPVFTPLQALLLDGSWLDGRCELYQPIEAPELKKDWILVRKCTDRLAKMRSFLQDQGLMPPQLHSYLDVGCAYGWFVKQMESLGFEASGVDRDLAACMVGVVVYGMRPTQLSIEDIVHFLRTRNSSYDVISCFSVLHHYARGNMSASAETLINLLDRSTRKILFFETGQGHEEWHRESLAKWDDDFIENWLRQHTSFKKIYRLGRDEDAVPPFQRNYGRMLFACCR